MNHCFPKKSQNETGKAPLNGRRRSLLLQTGNALRRFRQTDFRQTDFRQTGFRQTDNALRRFRRRASQRTGNGRQSFRQTASRRTGFRQTEPRRRAPQQTALRTPFLHKIIRRKSPAGRLALFLAATAATGTALAFPAPTVRPEPSVMDAAANRFTEQLSAVSQRISDKNAEKNACNDEACRNRVQGEINTLQRERFNLQKQYANSGGGGARREAEGEFGALGGRDLDGGPGGVITDPGHYDAKADRLGNEITGLDSNIAGWERDLRTCSSDCDSIRQNLRAARTDRANKQAEKTKAEQNRDSLRDAAGALQETTAAQRNAATSAKKKVEKQKKFLYLAGGVSAAAGAYFFKKCYTCSPSCTPFCVMGGLALANAGINVKKAGELGKTAGQLGSVGQGICSSMPHLCTPGNGLCNSHPDQCLPSDNFCTQNPAQCTNSGGSLLPPPDLCVHNPDACLPSPDICETNPESCEPEPAGPEVCARNPFPPQCIQAAADCPEGEPCPTEITIPCPQGKGMCQVTVPGNGSGDYAGAGPLKITPLNGDPPYKVAIGDAPDYKDPAIKAEIEKANRHLKQTQAGHYDAIDALSGDGTDGGGFGGAHRNPAASPGDADSEESYGFGEPGGGEGALAGSGMNGLGGAGGRGIGGLRGGRGPYKNLMSQYKGRQKADLLGEKSMTIGEDRIGVAEDNIFFMARSAYDAGRKEKEFCGDPVPCPLPALSIPKTKKAAKAGSLAGGRAAADPAGDPTRSSGANKNPLFVPPPPPLTNPPAEGLSAR